MVYGTSSKIGSIEAMYGMLQYRAAGHHNEVTGDDGYKVAGNKNGQFATMASVNGIIFGVINIVGNFGTVFVDNA